MERDLVALGRVAHLITRGRHTGRPRSVAVGYVAEAGDTIVVAANGPDHDWARNLAADPHATVEIGERSYPAVAEPLGRDEHVRAIRELILRYGTPSEGLGSGPSFRLRPLDPAT